MIISISGPDTYRSREKLKSIQKLGLQKQAKQEIFSFNDIELPDTEETLLARLKQSFNTSSLFVDKRLIIIKDLIALPKTLHTKVKKTLQSCKDSSDIIVLFYDTDTIPKAHPLTKVLIDLKAKITQYEYLPESKAIAYIHQMSLDQRIDISREAIMYLLNYQKQEHKNYLEKIGNKSKSQKSMFRIDFYKIEFIFNQLYNYYGETQNITISMIQSILLQESTDSVFSLADHIYRQHYGEYLVALKNLEQMGIEGIALYGLFISQIKTALIIKLAQEKGHQYTDYVKGNPYILQITAQNIRNWKSQDLKKIYLDLIEGDYTIKFEGKNPYDKLKELGIGYVT
jgi:DNA polymerase III delta subunit